MKAWLERISQERTGGKEGKQMDKWTSANQQFLIKLLDMGKTQAEIADIFGCSESAVSRKLRSLGIRTKRYWTPKEEAELKRLVSEKKTSAQIAKRLGRTQKAVSIKRVVLGIDAPATLSTKNPLHLAEVIKFRMAGWKLSEIAEVYGVKQPSVCSLLCKKGFKGRFWVRPKHTQKRKRWSEVEVAIVRKSVKKGLSPEEIQLKLQHRSVAAIRKRVLDMTRYWPTVEEQVEREHLRKKWMQWRVY